MSDLFHNLSLLVPLTVFVGGILGSPHCMSMCGPLVLNFASQPKALAFYQLGRMTSYTLIGAIVGSFGHLLLGSTGASSNVSTIALLLMATLLVMNGVRAIRGSSLHYPTPRWLANLSNAVWKSFATRRLPPLATSTGAGFLTVLLPCGHLASFLIGAAATGSAWRGGLFMFAFWLGSAPLLSFGTRWLHRMLGSQNPRRQRIAGVILVVAGLYSLGAFAMKAHRSHAIHRSQSSIGIDHEHSSKPEISPDSNQKGAAEPEHNEHCDWQ